MANDGTAARDEMERLRAELAQARRELADCRSELRGRWCFARIQGVGWVRGNLRN